MSSTAAWAQTDINLAASDQVWRGAVSGGMAGASLDQGNLDAGNQRRDLIVGSPGSGSVAGHVHLVFGGPIRSGEQSLSTADVTLTGTAGDRFGAATAAGNIRTTETSGAARELVVGAPGDNGGAGAVYLFWTFVSGSDKTLANALLKISGAPGEQLGTVLATADLNGDGYREIVAVAPGSNRVYVFNGSATLGDSPTVNITTSAANITITNRAIRSLAAGDINGDGRTDLILGAPFENSSTGEVWVLFGQAGGFPAAISLPTATGVNVVSRFGGVNVGDLAGTAVALGDFDNDGIRDLFVGAPEADPAGRPGAGVVYLFFGGSSLTTSASLTSAPTIFYGEATGNRLGTAMVAGDINRDTPDDVVMLAPGASGGMGGLFVYYGGSRSQRRGILDLLAGVSRRMYADPALGSITSAVVFEVTGEGARDIIAGVATADGGPGTDSGLLYFSISPKLLLNSTRATFGVPQGNARSTNVLVTNPGVFDVTWSATTNASWLTATPASGHSTTASPGVLTVRADATGLGPGTYTGTVTVRSTTIHLIMTQLFTVTLNVRACTVGGRTAGDFSGDGCVDLATFSPTTGSWNIEDATSQMWGLATDIRVPGDYNGDGRTDIAVYRPSTGTWYIKDIRTVVYGIPGDVPVPGDYNGDGITDVAVWRPSTGQWFIENQGSMVWGRTGDTPVQADYNGDGRTEPAVYRRSTGRWYFSTGGSVEWGGPGDIPVPADYNGDGIDDVAFWRPSTGQWAVKDQFTFAWGMAGDIPVPLDRNGDGRADLMVYRPSIAYWFIKSMTPDTTETVVTGGAATDVPVLMPPPIGTLVQGDMDADRKADLLIFRPSNGNWYNLLSGSGFTNYTTKTWGLAGDIPVTGDFDADGRADMAVFRPSTGSWYYLHSSTGNTSYTKIDWGLNGDTPVPGDYMGTGYSQIVVYRPGSPSRWFIRGGPYIDFGMTGDIPAPADFDGDGRLDIAVFRPSTHAWYVKLSSQEFATFVSYNWGATGDVPTPADYDGDGKADLATWRPSDGNWRISYSSTNFTSGLTALFGNSPSDIPVPGDYNNDGRTDIAVWRPSLGRFYVRDLFSIDFGANGDIPVLQR